MNFSHNLGNVILPEDYSRHPEWFPMDNGKRFKPSPLLLNWQPDLGSDSVVERAANYAVHELRTTQDRPAAVALGINDTVFFGDSPEAMRWVTPLNYFRGRPNYSNLVFSFMNRVAEQVELTLNTHGGSAPPVAAGAVRGVFSVAAARMSKPQQDWRLGCLAYYWCEQVPSFQIHPRIVPFLCADRAQGYDPDFWKEEMDLQERWGRTDLRLPTSDLRAQPRIGLYDYLDGWGFLVPRVHTRLLAEHLKHAKKSGFTDYFGEASPNWGLDGPQMWMVAQLLAHPEADATALLYEYYNRYFAEAAAPMRSFFELCEALWMAQPPPAKWLKYFRNEAQVRLFPAEERLKLRALLNKAAAQATQEKVRNRVQLVSDAFGVTERFAKYVEAKRALSALNTLSPKAESQPLLSALQECLTAREKLECYFAEVKRRQPLAVYYRDLSDFTWLEPIYDAALLAGKAIDELKTNADSQALRAAKSRLKSQNIASVALQSSSFEESVNAGRRVGGLQYGADLPQGWLSKLEPTEGMIACSTPDAARSGRAGLRLANQVYASVFQWLPIDPKTKGFELDAWFRGELSNGARASLYLAWIDDKGLLLENHKCGVKYEPVNHKSEAENRKLKADSLPSWTRLTTGSLVPPQAKWVGIVILANYMVPGDWVDVDDVTLRSY